MEEQNMLGKRSPELQDRVAKRQKIDKNRENEQQPPYPTETPVLQKRDSLELNKVRENEVTE